MGALSTTLLMALDRWIALVLLLIFAVYGYTAFFTMDAGLPPFMQRNPVWPSTFPKVLSVMGMLVALFVLTGIEKVAGGEKPPEIDYRRLTDYKLGQAIVLLGLMVAYAFLLRPAGFILSTSLFLILSAAVLGERNWTLLLPVGVITSVGVWYLVEKVLGIFLRPFPYVFG